MICELVYPVKLILDSRLSLAGYSRLTCLFMALCDLNIQPG